MKVLIDISQDHKRVIDNLVSDGKGYLLPQEVETRLAKAVKIGTVIPNNATNGDVIKAMFPQFDVNEEWKATRHFEFKSKECIEITGIATSDWWNAPWKGQKE